jgi:hypothetical protein
VVKIAVKIEPVRDRPRAFQTQDVGHCYCTAMAVSSCNGTAIAVAVASFTKTHCNISSSHGDVFYENALPFRIADSQSLAAAADQSFDFGEQHPGCSYKDPNQRKISGPLIESAFEDTTATAQPIMYRGADYL